MAKVNSYISLVRATEDEIKKEFSEIIEGQIIFDTTNKTISCDEQGRRIEYTGKETKDAIGVEMDVEFDGDDTYKTMTDYHKDDIVMFDGKLYVVNRTSIPAGYQFTKEEMEADNTLFQRTTLTQELKKLRALTFELRGEDLYITQNV